MPTHHRQGLTVQLPVGGVDALIMRNRVGAALRRPGTLATVALLLAFAVYAVSLLPGVRSPGEEFGWSDDWLSNIVQVGSALLCLATGWRRRQRPWVAAGIGLTCWAVGDVYWLVALSDRDPIPYPSIADALYLAMYPGAYIAVVLLLKAG
jgi:hypothetical protein